MDLVGIDPAKERFLSIPDHSRKIMGLFGLQLWTLAPPAEISTATKVVVTAAGKGVHIVKRPYDSFALGNGSEE